MSTIMINNNQEAITKLREVFDNGRTFKNLDVQEITEVLKEKRLLDQFIPMFASEIFASTKENQKISRENIIRNHPNLTELQSYQNIDKLIGYLYYEYSINESRFLKLIDLIIGENNRALKDKLVNDKIIFIDDEKRVSLTHELGLKLAVELGYSINDFSKEVFVEKVKSKIK